MYVECDSRHLINGAFVFVGDWRASRCITYISRENTILRNWEKESTILTAWFRSTHTLTKYILHTITLVRAQQSFLNSVVGVFSVRQLVWYQSLKLGRSV